MSHIRTDEHAWIRWPAVGVWWPTVCSFPNADGGSPSSDPAPPAPPVRRTHSPLGSTPRRNPVAPGSLSASLPQDGGSQVALLASPSHPNRPLWRFCRDRSGFFWHLCDHFSVFLTRGVELKVRVLVAMSSGEGAEETTTKDAGDVAAFFKTGKPENGWAGSGCAPARAAPPGSVTLLPSLLGVCGARSERYSRV